LHIPLPPLVEQQRIVTEIEKWFALIDQIEQGKVNLQTTIKQIKSKILDLAIHGKLVPQDPNDEPSIELLQRINPDFTPCDNGHYPFDVPNEWKWCKMNDLCSFLSRGKSPKYSEDDKTYPVFAQKCNLKEGGISLEQAKFLDPSTINKWDSKYKLQTGDVLVNSTGTGTVGRTRLFDESCLGKYPFVVPDSHVSVVRTYEEINSEYVFAYMSSQLIQQYIEDNLAGSTNQKELYIGVLENLYFPLPPIKEQQRIVQKIEKLFSILDNIQNAFRSVFVYTSKG
jgi:type I restriction enzyme S subunit